MTNYSFTQHGVTAVSAHAKKTAGVIFSPRRENHLRGRAHKEEAVEIFFSNESNSA